MLLFLFVATASADDASRQAKAAKLLELTNVSQMMNQMMDQMKTMAQRQMASLNMPADQAAAAGESTDQMMNLIKEKLSWEKLQPLYTKLYSDVYTEEELDGIVAFYSSPAGHAMVAKQPQLMAKSMELIQPLMGNLQAEIMKTVQDLKAKQGAAEKK